MSEANNEIGYLFINGLGDGKITFKDRLVRWWWARSGRTIEHAQINWYDGKELEDKLAAVRRKVDEMLGSFGNVAIIGSSAGGSLAVNSYYNLVDKNVCAVNAHGRLRAGNYAKSHRMSLYHRAHLDTSKPSQSFFDSVTKAEIETIPNLSDDDKNRILVLTQLTDLVVPLDTMSIEGAHSHRSIAFGHSGGLLAHLLTDRDLIIGFAESSFR